MLRCRGTEKGFYQGGGGKNFSIRFLIADGMSLNLMFYDYDYEFGCV